MWRIEGGYTLRLTAEQDAELAAQWTKADPEHDGRFPSTFWLEKNPSTDGMILQDEDGNPVLFLRIERFARVHVQFPPMKTRKERIKVMKAVDTGMRWLMVRLGVLGFCGVIFASRVKGLREFFKNRYGFSEDEYLYKPIPVYTPPNYRHMGAPLGADEKVN